jgi:hypothetical protein
LVSGDWDRWTPAWVKQSQEPGAPVQLDQQRHDRGEGQQLGQLCLQRRRLGRDVLGGQWRDDQFALLVEANRSVPAIEDSLQFAQRVVQLLACLGQGGSGVGGLAHQPAELHPLCGPLLRGEQVDGRIGVAPRARHEHIPGTQPVAQRHQRAQLPVVPIAGDIPGLGRGLEVAAPAGRDEPRRRLQGPCAPRLR